MQIVTWTTTTAPAGVQPDWGVTTILPIALPGSRGVGRLPDGAPLPSGAAPYTPPVATEHLRELAREQLKAIADRDDPLMAELAVHALADDTRLDRVVERGLGEAHPYAELAPWTVSSLDEACSLVAKAVSLWTSPCSCAVIRTSMPGYQVWSGIGSMLESAGSADTYDAAEQRAFDAVRANRSEVIAQVREILSGWAPATPFYAATLATIEDLPIQVRRGPMTGSESSGARVCAYVDGHPVFVGGSSWDLPVVARLEAGQVTRWPERVTWDDDESRQAHRDRTRDGQRQRRAEERQACELLRRHSAIAPLVRQRSLAARDIDLRSGESVRTLGGVRMREDGKVPLALVRYQGMRLWMAIGEFAA